MALLAGVLSPAAAAAAASAAANIGVEIVDPVSLRIAPSAATSAPAGARMAPLSAGVVEVSGPAGQVFSVEVASSPALTRSAQAPPGPAVGLRAVGEVGAAVVRVEGATQLSGRETAGRYQASATVTVNFN